MGHADFANTVLLELIKFDMAQIQRYREAVFNISIFFVTASFAMSVFFLNKEKSSAINIIYRRRLLMLANVGALLILTSAAILYFSGLYDSIAALEMRQDALIDNLFNPGAPLSKDSLYPKLGCHVNVMGGWLEKMPLLAAMFVLGVKTYVEWIIFRPPTPIFPK